MHRVAVIAVVVSLLSGTAHAQPMPRTGDGSPDFQGVWSAPWITPLERPPEAAELVVSASEAGRLFDVLWERFDSDKLQPLHSLDVAGLAIVRGEARSSLIIDPPDGRLPLTEAGRARRGSPPSAAGLDGPEQRTPGERCMPTGNAVAPMVVLPAGNMKQIVQTSDHLVILHETFGALRIIPLHPLARGPRDAGRGSWEGDTLVVETAGFAPSERVRSGRFVQFPISPKSTIKERFRRTSADEIVYTFTVEDADLYTRPWTAEMSLMRSDARLYEWGCQEANHSMVHMLLGARIEEGREAKQE